MWQFGTQHSWTCFGCSSPHPYSEYCPDNGHVVIFLNRDSPEVRDNANENIEKMRKNRKKWHIQNTKRKNLGMVNLSDFDDQGRQRITEQVLQSVNRHNISEHSSVTSSISTPGSVSEQGKQCGHGCGRSLGRGMILVADAVFLAAGLLLKRAMPISIQSNLPHIVLQFGTNSDCPNCPSICCAID
jgi:hypothetical protein